MHNTIVERKANSLQIRNPQFRREQFVIAGGGTITQTALDHWKNHAFFLPRQESLPEMAKEFAARSLQQVEITAVIDVIANGALGVGDAVMVSECGDLQITSSFP